MAADTAAQVQQLRKDLEPLRQTLKTNQFLGGSQPNYADIAVAGNFLVRLKILHNVASKLFCSSALQTLSCKRQHACFNHCLLSSLTSWAKAMLVLVSAVAVQSLNGLT